MGNEHQHSFGSWSEWTRSLAGLPTDATHYRKRECSDLDKAGTGCSIDAGGREFDYEDHSYTLTYGDLNERTHTAVSNCKCGKKIRKSATCEKAAYGGECNVPGCEN